MKGIAHARHHQTLDEVRRIPFLKLLVLKRIACGIARSYQYVVANKRLQHSIGLRLLRDLPFRHERALRFRDGFTGDGLRNRRVRGAGGGRREVFEKSLV